MTDHSSPEKSPWGWKALIIFCILSGFFMLFFWLAVSNEPDYMPSQQNKQNTQQHAFKNAPVMSQEALAKAQADREARQAAGANVLQDPSVQENVQQEHDAGHGQ
ncbi:hypothetical protein OC498_08595 [Acinetobacter bohemicus]|uniref:Uncharacterized protein n=1 Tax=Acinetobacter lwoffii TaxID=28090 RepID=A0A9D2US37_ACILW|nr:MULTISPECIES: hypothetical protein [Acinetobacter]MCO8042648.1 hypothetical protein [Acinetobacter sp. S4400-12]MCU7224962.1 hypothetical protein [Acinetobacter bohemicus]HJF27720.1 hypothetical protein [Acinetobacter lwoffii]